MINETKDLLCNFPETKLYVDYRCHLTLPIHVILNQASEQFKGKNKIGSVGKGIGATVEDKVNRTGIRINDLLEESSLKDKVSFLYEIRYKQIKYVFDYKEKLCLNSLIEEALQLLSKLKAHLVDHISDVSDILTDKLSFENILIEGSQSTHLDNAFGTYPFTVSYPTLASSVFHNIGLPVTSDFDVIGVMKCYTIRVGNGPFNTEIFNEVAEVIRKYGNEYGTVSGRPRRCGWLDLPMVKKSIRLNGVKKIMITNLDVLSKIPEFQVCIDYDVSDSKCTPVYRSFKTWRLNKNELKQGEFPRQLKDFLSFLQDYLQVKIAIISFGAERADTFIK